MRKKSYFNIKSVLNNSLSWENMKIDATITKRDQEFLEDLVTFSPERPKVNTMPTQLLMEIKGASLFIKIFEIN